MLLLKLKITIQYNHAIVKKTQNNHTIQSHLLLKLKIVVLYDHAIVKNLE